MNAVRSSGSSRDRSRGSDSGSSGAGSCSAVSGGCSGAEAAVSTNRHFDALSPSDVKNAAGSVAVAKNLASTCHRVSVSAASHSRVEGISTDA